MEKEEVPVVNLGEEPAEKADVAKPARGKSKAKPTLYAVEVKHLPQKTVEAETPDEAWEKYKKAVGITASEHCPKIQLVTE